MAPTNGKNLYVRQISRDQADLLKEKLTHGNWQIKTAPHALWKAVKDKTNITAYTSGKLVIQGKGTSDVVRHVLEPEILGEARFGYEKEWAHRESPEMFKPHIGIDESGKGDFFGPLVISGVFVDEKSSDKLFEAGITDSKSINSSNRIYELEEVIQETTQPSYDTVTIGPASYNRLYEKMGNLNKLLAWGHARVLENVLAKCSGCERAVSDQFADKRVVERALMDNGRAVKLEQYPRAEKDVAVAAASILARAAFLRGLDELADKAAVESLPKGAGPQVKEAARDIVENLGEDALPEFVKTHFKTTADVLRDKTKID